MNTATFAKLNDGSWGLRIQGDTLEGDTVLTVRKDGTKSIKTVGVMSSSSRRMVLLWLASRKAEAAPLRIPPMPAVGAPVVTLDALGTVTVTNVRE